MLGPYPSKACNFLLKMITSDREDDAYLEFAFHAAISPNEIFHVYRVVIRRNCGSNPNLQLKRH